MVTYMIIILHVLVCLLNRSILKVDGLMQNDTEYVGRYFCHVELEDGGTVIVSNTSTATIIDESSTYTNRERCFEDGLFLNLASNGPCLSFSSNVVPPTSDEGSEETTMVRLNSLQSVPSLV